MGKAHEKFSIKNRIPMILRRERSSLTSSIQRRLRCSGAPRGAAILRNPPLDVEGEFRKL
jgi:hypothetical protein